MVCAERCAPLSIFLPIEKRQERLIRLLAPAAFSTRIGGKALIIVIGRPLSDADGLKSRFLTGAVRFGRVLGRLKACAVVAGAKRSAAPGTHRTRPPDPEGVRLVCGVCVTWCLADPFRVERIACPVTVGPPGADPRLL